MAWSEEQMAAHHVAMALAGEVVCATGQVNAIGKRALDKLVKAGKLCKWRGRWYPIPGSQFGLGPLKTCWGTPEAKSAALSG